MLAMIKLHYPAIKLKFQLKLIEWEDQKSVEIHLKHRSKPPNILIGFPSSSNPSEDSSRFNLIES